MQQRKAERELVGGSGGEEQNLELAETWLELVFRQTEVAEMLEVTHVEAVQPEWQLEIVVAVEETMSLQRGNEK
jgi:hypothetical protein